MTLCFLNMNYAIDTADFDLKQHISLCKLLAILIAILHLQGGFSGVFFSKMEQKMLPMSALEERCLWRFPWPSQLRLFEDSPRSTFFPLEVSGAWVFSGYKSYTVVDDGVAGRCFNLKKTILRCIEKEAQFLSAIPEKRKQVSANTWLYHRGGGVPMYPKDWSPWGCNTVDPVVKEERSNQPSTWSSTYDDVSYGV